MKKGLLVVLALTANYLTKAQFTGTGPVTTTDKVGIGTTNPQQELHIYGTNSYLRIDGTLNSGLEIYESGSRRWIIDNLVASDRLRFYSNSAGEVLSLLQNGNVGIGATNPLFNLTVGANLNNSYQSNPYLASAGIMSHGIGSAKGNLYLHRDDVTISANNVLGSIKFTGADGGEQVGAEIQGVSAGSWSTGQSSSDLAFLTTTSGSATPTEKFRISDDGNVGIGTTSPSGSISSNQTGLHILNDNVSYLSLESTAGSGKKYTMYSSTTGSLVFWDASSSTMRGIIGANGNWGIGTATPSQKLEVNGTIRSKEVKVEANGWPDYVFEPDYNLRTLKETKKYITENKHLPEIPSASEIGENGIDLGDMNMRLLKKIEELTLYQIELLERLEKAEGEIYKLKEK